MQPLPPGSPSNMPPDRPPDLTFNWPGIPSPSAGGGLAHDRRPLALVLLAGLSGGLVVALLGALLLLLSNSVHGATLGGQAQTGKTGQTQATASSVPSGHLSATLATQTAVAAGGNTSSPGTGTPRATPTIAQPVRPSVHQVTYQHAVDPGSGARLLVYCPKGEIALSGGWDTEGSAARVTQSLRYGTDGWQVFLYGPAVVSVTAYAECLKNAAGATISERANQVSILPGNANLALARCNAGETLVGGGFALDRGLDLYNFSPSADAATQWVGYAQNDGDAYADLTVSAECLAAVKAQSRFAASQQASITAGGSGAATSVSCPRDMSASGGGYATDSGATLYRMKATGGAAWQAAIAASGGRDELLRSYALCLGF